MARLVNILFPELEKLVSSLHIASVYALLSEFPGASYIAGSHLTHLKNVRETASKGRYRRNMAVTLRDATKDSIGSVMPAKSMELKHTIHLIKVMMDKIDEIEVSIKSIMGACNSPIMTIPGISYRMGAMILAEIGNFSRFSNVDQILAFAGLSPSTYQSGQLNSSYSHMEKRVSRYLRYALFNATKYVCHWNESFGAYLSKRISEGKHYNVAVGHATKKLIRTIYRMELTGEAYRK